MKKSSNKLRPCGSNIYAFSFLQIDGNTNERLEGAIFELRDHDLVVTCGISDEDGIVLFEDIEQGTYKLYEVKAPNGYLTNYNVYEVIVRGCNRTTLDGVSHRCFIVENFREEIYS